MNKILIINDIPSYGKVASSVITPILSSMGYNLSTLPTALVSNVLDFGKFEIMDLSEYMKKTISIWENLNFKFDCIYTGFINSDEQFEIIGDYIKKNNNSEFVVIDPVMGDDGYIYPGLSSNLVRNMKNFIKYAHLITPNLTEAAYLLDKDPSNLILDEEEIKNWILQLKDMGPNSVVITSVRLKDDSSYCVYGYDNSAKDFFKVSYEYIDVRFPGTGDVFTSKLIGEILNNNSLEESCKIASDFVKNCIDESLKYDYRFEEGMQLEKLLLHN